MTRGIRLLCLLCLALPLTGAVYEWGGPARKGVRELREKKYDEALRDLHAGRAELPQAAAIPYDEGLAHFGRGAADSAAARFEAAMKLRGDPARAAAAYNLGNIAMRGKDYPRAAGYYKEALRVAPGDLDAKRNLEEALRRMRQPRSPNRQQPPARQPPPNPDGSQNPLPRQGPGKGEPPPRGSAGEFTKQEAERWLQALESERRAKRQESKSKPGEGGGNRDW